MPKATFCYETARELRRIMTREELAEHLGVSPTTIEYACNEKYREKAIARALARHRRIYIPKRKQDEQSLQIRSEEDC